MPLWSEVKRLSKNTALLPPDGVSPLDQWQIWLNQEQKAWLGVSLIRLSALLSGGVQITMSNVCGVQIGNNNIMSIVQKQRRRHQTAPSRVGTSYSHSESSPKKPQWLLHTLFCRNQLSFSVRSDRLYLWLSV